MKKIKIKILKLATLPPEADLLAKKIEKVLTSLTKQAMKAGDCKDNPPESAKVACCEALERIILEETATMLQKLKKNSAKKNRGVGNRSIDC